MARERGPRDRDDNRILAHPDKPSAIGNGRDQSGPYQARGYSPLQYCQRISLRAKYQGQGYPELVGALHHEADTKQESNIWF